MAFFVSRGILHLPVLRLGAVSSRTYSVARSMKLLLRHKSSLIMDVSVRYLSSSGKKMRWYDAAIKITSDEPGSIALSATLTPDLEEEILEGKVAKKLKLKAIQAELVNLENRKYPFPMPPQLSLEQWRGLLAMGDDRVRLLYLHSLYWNTGETLEHFLEMDDNYCRPLSEAVDQQMVEEAVGQGDESEERRRRINMYLMHHWMMKQKGERVHAQLNQKYLNEIALLENNNRILRYINYITKTENAKQRDFIKRSWSRKHLGTEEDQESWKKIAAKNEPHIYYGLGYNTIFLRTPNQAIDRYNNYRAVREFHEWGQPIVCDFSYLSEYSSKKTLSSLIFKEISNAYAINRESDTPFQLHFTGVGDDTKKRLVQAIPSILDDHSPVRVTSENTLDVFNPERLVILSPDSRNDLLHFDPEDVYVIGAIVDTMEKQPLTLSRAKRHKIRHARLPMKRVMGIKADLNIDTCLAIMCDMKASNDWFYSFRWVPPRLLLNRVKTAPKLDRANIQNQLVHLAHTVLCPNNKNPDQIVRNRMLNPRSYRELYQRVMNTTSQEEINAIVEEMKI